MFGSVKAIRDTAQDTVTELSSLGKSAKVIVTALIGTVCVLAAAVLALVVAVTRLSPPVMA